MKKLYISLLVSQILSGLVHQSFGQKLNKLLFNAEKAYNESRLNSALEQSSNILVEDPGNQKALFIRVKTLIKLDSLDRAYSELIQFKLSTEINQSDLFETWYTLGNSYKNYYQYRSSDFPEVKESVGVTEWLKMINRLNESNKIISSQMAVKCYINAKEYSTDDLYPIYKMLGITCYEAEMYPMGIEYLTKLISTEPENGGYYYFRGLCYFGIDSLNLAKTDFNKSLLHLEPKYLGESYCGIGRVLYSQKNYIEAIEYFDKSIRSKAPDIYLSYYYMGLSKWFIGDETACGDLKISTNGWVKKYEEDFKKLCIEK